MELWPIWSVTWTIFCSILRVTEPCNHRKCSAMKLRYEIIDSLMERRSVINCSLTADWGLFTFILRETKPIIKTIFRNLNKQWQSSKHAQVLSLLCPSHFKLMNLPLSFFSKTYSPIQPHPSLTENFFHLCWELRKPLLKRYSKTWTHDENAPNCKHA